MIRVASKLDEKVEEMVAIVIDSAVAVHRELGPGFLESTYRRALCVELSERQLPFEQERVINVAYRGVRIAQHRLDVVVGDAVLVELKAGRCLEPAHHAQVIAYLKAANLPVGLLMNFGQELLKSGLRRFVL